MRFIFQESRPQSKEAELAVTVDTIDVNLWTTQLILIPSSLNTTMETQGTFFALPWDDFQGR